MKKLCVRNTSDLDSNTYRVYEITIDPPDPEYPNDISYNGGSYFDSSREVIIELPTGDANKMLRNQLIADELQSTLRGIYKKDAEKTHKYFGG